MFEFLRGFNGLDLSVVTCLVMGAAVIGIGVKLVFPLWKPVAVLTFYQEERSVDGRRHVSMYFYADGFGSFLAFDSPENVMGFVRLLGEKYRVVNLSAFPYRITE